MEQLLTAKRVILPAKCDLVVRPPSSCTCGGKRDTVGWPVPPTFLQTRSIHRALQYGEREDPCKMTHSGMALIRRGPSAKPANSNSHAGHVMQAADQHTLAYAAGSNSTSGSSHLLHGR